VAGVLVVIGVVLWLITWATNRFLRHEDTTINPENVQK